MENDRSTLDYMEPHPCAEFARSYIQTIGMPQLLITREALASCAIEGNRVAEICLGTLNRLLASEPVSDRYIMGLAWYFIETKELYEN